MDVNAVEVLKGPQSTLYGKNVSAGVISVRTQAPTRDFESMVELEGGNRDLRQVKGFVSGPLFSDFMGRLSGVVTKAGPTMTNLLGPSQDDRGSMAIRGQLLYQPNGQFSTRFITAFVHKEFHAKQVVVFSGVRVTTIIRTAGAQATKRTHGA